MCVCCCGENSRFPSTSPLRFGRDDNSYLGTGCGAQEKLSSRKKVTNSRIKKGRATLPCASVADGENSRSPFDFAQGRLSTAPRIARQVGLVGTV